MIRRLLAIGKNHWPLLLILLISGFLLFFRLGRDPLWDWDECIYTQYALEMQKSGDVMSNHWNGGIRLEKPTLYIAALQIPFAFGVNEFSARLFTVIFALLLILFTYLLAARYFSKYTAVLATLILLCAESIIVYSIRVNTELPFAACVLAGVYFWLGAKKYKNLSYLAGALFALGIMIKGLSVQFLPALILSVFINFSKEKVVNLIRALTVFVAIILPWHLAQFVVYGSKFYQVYIYENIIQKVNNPVEFHFGGRLYYLKLFFKELFPWLAALAIVPLYYLLHIKKFLKKKAFFEEIKKQEVLLTIILFIAVPLIALTRAQTKIAWYIISIYPFLAIFLAYSLTLLLEIVRKKHKLLFPILFALLAVMLAVDSGRLLINETRLFQGDRTLSPREKTLYEVKKMSGATLDYLVQFSERRAKETLAPHLATSTTFIYGGNPCAVLFTEKKVNYYYEIPAFQKRVKQGKGLYLIENGDLWTVKGLGVKKLYGNTDFTVFAN